MGGNGGEKRGGGWGNSGHSTQDVGCGGLWRDVVRENRRKMGQFEKKMGEKWEVEDLPHSSPFVKISFPHSSTEKWEFLPFPETHHHGG